MKLLFGIAILALIVIVACSKKTNQETVKEEKKDSLITPPLQHFSIYDSVVLSDQPVGYWLLQKGDTADESGHQQSGIYYGSATVLARLPNSETAAIFNGIDSYFQIPDKDYLEVTRTGTLTIEAWMCPAVVNFIAKEGDGYVHWMGKGSSKNHLWAARIYNQNNSSRPQRISGYCFNADGGLGSGSYFQDTISTSKWVHYVLVINTVNSNSSYPSGYMKIYRDGVLRDKDSLSEYQIVPSNGNAPMRIATKDFSSFFNGAIGKVAIYDYELSPAQIQLHKNVMRGI